MGPNAQQWRFPQRDIPRGPDFDRFSPTWPQHRNLTSPPPAPPVAAPPAVAPPVPTPSALSPDTLSRMQAMTSAAQAGGASGPGGWGSPGVVPPSSGLSPDTLSRMGAMTAAAQGGGVTGPGGFGSPQMPSLIQGPPSAGPSQGLIDKITASLAGTSGELPDDFWNSVTKG